jgi:vancomycin permeability regulator SanA
VAPPPDTDVDPGDDPDDDPGDRGDGPGDRDPGNPTFSRRTRGPEGPNSTRKRRWRTRLIRAGGVVLLVAALVLTATYLMVTRAADGLAYDDPADVPVRPVAVVFGAGLVAGKPSPALADRVHGAVRLYQQGRVSHLLMTGDNSVVTYDEVTAMKDQAVAEGVPGSAITRDYAGFSTYDSCYRARDVFGIRAAVLVTQDYHLPRALYSCRELGIDAVGLIIPDWQHHPDQATAQYPRLQSTYYMGREWFARSKSVLAAKVTHPGPQFLGPYEGLRET